MTDQTPIPEADQIMLDLSRAVKALDRLPNTLVVGDRGIDIATISVLLSNLVKVLGLSDSMEQLAEVRLKVRQATTALHLGHIEEASRLNSEAQAIMDRLNELVF